jgi:hypothetical protein
MSQCWVALRAQESVSEMLTGCQTTSAPQLHLIVSLVERKAGRAELCALCRAPTVLKLRLATPAGAKAKPMALHASINGTIESSSFMAQQRGKGVKHNSQVTRHGNFFVHVFQPSNVTGHPVTCQAAELRSSEPEIFYVTSSS